MELTKSKEASIRAWTLSALLITFMCFLEYGVIKNALNEMPSPLPLPENRDIPQLVLMKPDYHCVISPRFNLTDPETVTCTPSYSAEPQP